MDDGGGLPEESCREMMMMGAIIRWFVVDRKSHWMSTQRQACTEALTKHQMIHAMACSGIGLAAAEQRELELMGYRTTWVHDFSSPSG